MFGGFCCGGFFWALFPQKRGDKSQKGRKGAGVKGPGSQMSHFSFCCAFRRCVVYSPCFPVWGEEKVMTIYDAGPLAAGPLCGLLKIWRENPRKSGGQKTKSARNPCCQKTDLTSALSSLRQDTVPPPPAMHRCFPINRQRERSVTHVVADLSSRFHLG